MKAFEKVREKMYARADADFYTSLNSIQERDKIEFKLKRTIEEIMFSEPTAAVLNRQQKDFIIKTLTEDILGYGPIQILLDDSEVTEIMVARWDLVYYEKHGKIYKSNISFRNENHLRNVIQKIVGPIGRRIDESSPMVDARLPDGSRVNAVIPPIAIDGACLTIRKFGKKFTREEFVKSGAIDVDKLDLLGSFVQGRLNIAVIGGTGSGKTTLLNVLSSYIPADERIITIEDSAELQLQQEHVIRLETRPPNLEGKGEISIRSLVKNALRMRPDRIIVGECRGGEALDMLQAMNTGHDGGMTTIHANSPRDAVSRLAVMVMMAGQEIPLNAIKEQIASALDLIIQTARLRDGTRKVIRVSEVAGVDDNGEVLIKDIFNYEIHGTDQDGFIKGKLNPTGYVPAFTEKLEWYGIKLDEDLFRR